MDRVSVSVIALMSIAGAAAAASTTGPSSSATPYVTAVAPDIDITSILTVGDSVNGYRLVGIPDGMGAYRNQNRDRFTLLVNHELNSTVGVERAHGGRGAFISKWTIDRDTLEVVSGEDLIKRVRLWDTASGDFVNGFGEAFSRFCSADLPNQSAFFDKASGLGAKQRIFMNGEESGAEGRAFASVLNGAGARTAYELAYLGKFSWENSVAAHSTGVKTVVAGLDDSGGGQLYMYVGDKQSTGRAVDKAGLTNGSLYGVKIDGVFDEDRVTGIGAATTFSLHNFGDVSSTSGAALEAASNAAEVTRFLRPEDGVWNPVNANEFYFVTTDRFDSIDTGTGAQEGNSRLWRLTFDDITNPTAGGSVEILIDGTDPGSPQMMDNMTMDRFGNILIQEDPGGDPYSARIWSYDTGSGELTELMKHDASRFGDIGIPATAPFSTNEEASGIIDAWNILGAGWFLANVQAHYSIGDPELVEGGQLFAFFNPASVPTPGAATLIGLAGLVGLRRRR